jgi:hypothetical protein
VGELPPDSPPPPGCVQVPAPALNDRCIGGAGDDTAFDCDTTRTVEDVTG